MAQINVCISTYNKKSEKEKFDRILKQIGHPLYNLIYKFHRLFGLYNFLLDKYIITINHRLSGRSCYARKCINCAVVDAYLQTTNN